MQHKTSILGAAALAITMMVAVPHAAQAMSLEKAEKVILKGIEKNAEKVKHANVGVYNAAKSGKLSSYCRSHTGDCIGVALEVALFL